MLAFLYDSKTNSKRSLEKFLTYLDEQGKEYVFAPLTLMQKELKINKEKPRSVRKTELRSPKKPSLNNLDVLNEIICLFIYRQSPIFSISI